MTADWIPTYQPRKWKKDSAQFEDWLNGEPVRMPWKRARFTRWQREQHLLGIENARVAARKLREERAANPSPELIAAHQELREAENAIGGRLGCARGSDMTDPQQVRALAQLLRDLPKLDRKERSKDPS